MYEKWEREKEILKTIGNRAYTVAELSDALGISVNLADRLLRHYRNVGYLKRYKNDNNLYAYVLSEKGKRQNAWLQSDAYKNYMRRPEEAEEKDRWEQCPMPSVPTIKQHYENMAAITKQINQNSKMKVEVIR